MMLLDRRFHDIENAFTTPSEERGKYGDLQVSELRAKENILAWASLKEGGFFRGYWVDVWGNRSYETGYNFNTIQRARNGCKALAMGTGDPTLVGGFNVFANHGGATSYIPSMLGKYTLFPVVIIPGSRFFVGSTYSGLDMLLTENVFVPKYHEIATVVYRNKEIDYSEYVLDPAAYG